ncbi:MAG: helix-turn-helix domain-containing protein [Thermoleophilia bacterium]
MEHRILAVPDHPLRRARGAAGLTQAQLAARAEVSRQAVGAVEAGRHLPAVDAALRIAAALGTSVEELFGAAASPEPPLVLGGSIGEGAPARLGRVGGRRVLAPLLGPAASDGAWWAADAVIEGGGVRELPGARSDGFVVVGCDPALGMCEALLAGAGPGRLVAIPGSSGAAVAALADGAAHAALVHGPAGALGAPPVPVRRVAVARWRVGVAVHPRRRAGSLEPIAAGRIPLVQRDPSAASQQALVRAMGAAGGAAPAGPLAGGHIEAARRAAAEGCAAVTFEPAAHAHGLRFLPLETHDVELWIGMAWADHPGARALCDLLASAAFRERVALVGGYELDRCGAAVGEEAIWAG